MRGILGYCAVIEEDEEFINSRSLLDYDAESSSLTERPLT